MTARALLVTALALLGCARKDNAAPKPASGEQRALELSLPRYPTGAIYRLSEDRGRVVVLEVWATWCEPCKELLPALHGMATELGDNVRVYGVNVDEDVRFVKTFMEETALKVPVLLDRDAVFAERELKIQVIPTTIVLDKGGRVRHVHAGAPTDELAKLKQQIESLLTEQG